MTLSSPTNATIAYGTGIVTIGASGATAVSTPGISAPPDVVVGNADGYINLPVTLSAPGVNTVTVNYATADGSGSGGYTSSALSNSVYQAEGTRTLTFTPGVTTQVVRVPLLNCDKSLTTGFFTFYLNLSGNSTGSTINRATTQIDVTGDASAASTPGLYGDRCHGRQQRRHRERAGGPGWTVWGRVGCRRQRLLLHEERFGRFGDRLHRDERDPHVRAW